MDKKCRIFTQVTATLAEKYHNIGFKEKNTIFRRKLVKIVITTLTPG
jgi:hypothetical protein